MAIFDSPEIAVACVGMEPLFISAIGHKEDVNLVQKVADKPFITPTALGQWLPLRWSEESLNLTVMFTVLRVINSCQAYKTLNEYIYTGRIR